MPRRRVVLIQGTFEILNVGHVRAFKFARSRGDYLIVALNTNALVRRYKGRRPVMSWQHKRQLIEAVRYVDQVVPAPDFSPVKLFKKYHVDVYVLSREWEHTKSREIDYMGERGGEVCFSRRYRGVSTTVIKHRLLEEHLVAVRSATSGQLGSRLLSKDRPGRNKLD